jgi:hypothetical protein
MATDDGAEGPDHPRRSLRAVHFPVYAGPPEDDLDELIFAARIRGITVGELMRERAWDDIPDWDLADAPEARADNKEESER